jgi:hypothetical protein
MIGDKLIELTRDLPPELQGMFCFQANTAFLI